jgi:hypothetical protein
MREWCPLKCGGWREWLDALPILKSVANVFFKHLYTVYNCSGYRWLQFPSNGSQSTWLDVSSQTQARIKHRCTEPQAVLAGSGLGLEDLTEQDVSDVSVHIGLWDAMDQPWTHLKKKPTFSSSDPWYSLILHIAPISYYSLLITHILFVSEAVATSLQVQSSTRVLLLNVWTYTNIWRNMT